MLNSLVWKETRELAPLVVGTLLLQLALVVVPAEAWLMLPFASYESRGSIPFVSDTLSTMFLVIGTFAAVAIGMAQTVLESSRGTFQFLLHRPARRDVLWLHKLATGILASLAVAGLPTLGYALWAATPRTHASPFYWDMTAWAFQLLLALPLVYLGAFLSGLRPGRYFGSRLLPLFAAMLLFMLMQMPGMPVALRVALILSLEALLVVITLHVGVTRDFS